MLTLVHIQTSTNVCFPKNNKHACCKLDTSQKSLGGTGDTGHGTIQYNTIQYNTIQYNTIQYPQYPNPPRPMLGGAWGGDIGDIVLYCIKKTMESVLGWGEGEEDNRIGFGGGGSTQTKHKMNTTNHSLRIVVVTMSVIRHFKTENNKDN